MRTRLQSIWDGLRSSYWFIPTLMAIFAVAMSLLAREIDQRYPETIETILPESAMAGPDGAREMLSTIAGSTITVAGVAFSILIVALSNASSQFGPRILRIYMQDTGSQIVLGTFTSTFLYCLVVLRTVRGTEDDQFVPHLSVTVGLVLALAGIGVLIYFLHHSASLIHISNITARIGTELQDSISTVFPEEIGEPLETTVEIDDIDLEGAAISEYLPPDEAMTVSGSDSGYIQAIEQERILDVAVKHDLIIQIVSRPGMFVVPGAIYAQFWTRGEHGEGEQISAAVRKAFIIGAQRTSIQEIEIFFDELIEIALRALSPSINDPYTAMTVVDWLSGALSTMVRRTPPSPFRYDRQGTLRVIAEPRTSIEFIDRVFDQIRDSAISHPMVLLGLLEMAIVVATRTSNAQQREALSRQAGIIARIATDHESYAPHIRDALLNKHREVVEVLTAGDRARARVRVAEDVG
ncbi:MAG: DUF2254 domain-containing protein [Chloroflexota bacterium]